MERLQILKTLFLRIAIVLCLCGGSMAIVAAEEGTLEIHGVEVFPTPLYENQPFEIHVTGFNVGQAIIQTPELPGEMSIMDNRIFVENVDNSFCFSPQPPLPPNEKPQRRVFALEGVPAGSYTLTTQIKTWCGALGQQLARNLRVYEDADQIIFGQESPSRGQVVSGVGVIRGWACFDKVFADTTNITLDTPSSGPVIGKIAYQIDNNSAVTIPYGSPRGDTEQVCGRDNTQTGFGAVTYWGRFGEGEHQFRLYIDGKEKSNFMFTIAASQAGFMKGIEAEYQLENFPNEGDTVKVRWSQADQNFIIVDYQ